jgi:Dyp-type peroxidase family
MSVLARFRDRFRRENVKLQLEDIQGLILRSRPEPYVGIHAMLHVDEAAGGRDLLGRLAAHVPSAEDWTNEMEAWVGLAISHQGLKALGLPEQSLSSFPLPFRAGMAARAEQLRDFGENAPDSWEEPLKPGVLHIALTIFAADKAALDKAVDKAMGELDRSSGVTLVATHEFGADEDAENPFGFRDAIAQPDIAGSGVEPLPGDGPAIAAGEFILGENSETGQPLGVPWPAHLGRNGSYVVLRKYDSRVGAFNDFIREHSNKAQEQEKLAAKMVGRWRSGAPLILSPDHDDQALGADPLRNNDFNFSKDPRGLLCPYSSHVRRLNPRDSKMTILNDVNIHRIIRRPSTFGPKWTPDVTAEDDARRGCGLYFIFISARACDTIEFLQQEWINRGNFIDLGEERDPIVGLHEQPGTFTIPDEPARRRVNGVSTFNRLRGGEYLFMPSLSSLKWIAEAGWASSG